MSVYDWLDQAGQEGVKLHKNSDKSDCSALDNDWSKVGHNYRLSMNNYY